MKNNNSPLFLPPKTDTETLPEICCGNCKFGEFDRSQGKIDFSVRECHRNPPYLTFFMLISPAGDQQIAGHSGFVKVNAREWCGRHKPRAQKADDVTRTSDGNTVGAGG